MLGEINSVARLLKLCTNIKCKGDNQRFFKSRMERLRESKTNVARNRFQNAYVLIILLVLISHWARGQSVQSKGLPKYLRPQIKAKLWLKTFYTDFRSASIWKPRTVALATIARAVCVKQRDAINRVPKQRTGQGKNLPSQISAHSWHRYQHYYWAI